jgi:heptosyltransferase-1
VAAAAGGYTVAGPASFGIQPPLAEANPPAWLPQRDYAVFFHGTARASKKWPQAAWVELAQHLSAYDLPILLAWGNAQEKQDAEQLATRIPQATVLPSLPMLEAVLLAQRAALAVGVDTGLTHIAAAYERPTVEIYCDSPRWKTEGNWSPCIINLGDAGQPPSVAEVWQAVQQLLTEYTARR